MRRRRVNKSAAHRETGLLERALAGFVGDFNIRLATLKTLLFYDATTTKTEKKVAIVQKTQKRGSRGGVRVQKKRRRQAKFLRLSRCLTITLHLKLQQENRNRIRMGMQRLKRGGRRRWWRWRSGVAIEK